MIKSFFTSFLLLMLVGFNIAIAQENCSDGIDNDGDGLIDLNDTDCQCTDITEVVSTSLIPNPSFEDTICCPKGIGQLSCAEDWIQASRGSSDYYNECGWQSYFPNVRAAPRPIPDGKAWAGFFNTDIIRPNLEHIGSCVTETLIAGRTYTVELWLALGQGATTFNLGIFGTDACSDLPWTEGCPVGEGNWQELTETSVNLGSRGWEMVRIDFIPPVNIEALAFGGRCGEARGDNYYFIDNIQINDLESTSNSVNIFESGDFCEGNLQLESTINTTGATPQWYRDGIALSGETNENLNLLAYGAGDFSVVYTKNDECIRSDKTVEINDLPVADFTISSIELNNNLEGTAPVNISLQDTSQNVSTTPVPNESFYWNLNNGTSAWKLSSDYFETIDTTYTEEGTYEICLIVNKDNCADTLCQVILVSPPPTPPTPPMPPSPPTPEDSVFISPETKPVNIFSPNGDNINDNFSFSHLEGKVSSFKCEIFNRWGLKVGELNNLQSNWDGTNLKGKPCSEGTYFYIYSYKDQNGETVSKQGDLQLVL